MEYILDKFFDDQTMSVHFKENVHIVRKKWKPWNWQVEILEEKPTNSYLMNLINSLYKEVEEKKECFLEIDRNFSKVLQIWPYRTVIVLPPLSDGIEITVVKPVKKLSIEDYNLDPSIIELLKDKAKWILISGAPWEWKTTFAQALVEFYVKQKKIVKTIESPRDLLVPDEVTQYSFSYAPHSEIRDILLLSRPDYTIYDEVRNQEDFILFKDLRLTWIWLVGVIHATNPIDSIQRFLWTIELWVIPQVIDTVIFIKWWNIQDILRLRQIVKVPEGMLAEDLARPVIQVYDFFTWDVKYEIYTYWEQVVVVPVDDKMGKTEKSPLMNYAARYLEEYFSNVYWIPTLVKPISDKSIKVYVPENSRGVIIWKWWENIMDLEKNLWISITVKNLEDLEEGAIIPKIEKRRKWKKDIIIIDFWLDKANKDVILKIGNETLKLTTDSNWKIQIKKKKLVEKIDKFGVKYLW
jgi:ATPase